MKLTFDEVMERIAEERPINEDDVPERVLERKVWVAEWHLPGCMSESFSVCTTKKEAVEAGLAYAYGSQGKEGSPRGMRKSLEKSGFFQHKTDMFGYVNTTVKQMRIRDLL